MLIMNRVVLSLVILFGLTSCFNKTSYDTTYIARIYEQTESSGDYTSLSGIKLYAFDGSTEDWEVAGYDDALAGIITSIDSGEQKGPFAWGEAYDDNETTLALQLDKVEVVIVAVNPATLTYGYTSYSVPINFPEVYVDLVFYSWKDGTYTTGKWTFVTPAFEDEEEEDDDDSQIEEDEEEVEEENEETEEEEAETEEAETEEETEKTE